MDDTWKNRWDERYSNDEFAYGVEPNNYLKEQLTKLTLGNVLFPAEGEGRNAVFAAKLGWEVTAFDISEAGKNKADQLALKNKVTIDYKLGEFQELDFGNEQFDVIALIYAHFPPNIKSIYYSMLDKYVKKGGTIIFEAFSKKHLEYVTDNPKVGGPKDLESLFSIEELRSYFPNYKVIELVEKEIELSEGVFHNGIGSVIRFVGQKNE
jgi:2-polyprenyl-3-methyl-5-hydroxy-6-metoxy-1,4-benzoquinol methylase